MTPVMYAVRAEHGHGSANGEVIAVFDSLDEALLLTTAPPDVWSGGTLTVWEMHKVWEDE